MGDEIEIVKAQLDRIESEGGSPELDFDDSALVALETYLRKDRVRDLPNELKSLVARRIADLAVSEQRSQGGAPHVDGDDISGVIASVMSNQAANDDPTKPITLCVSSGSPHVATYRNWIKRPGDKVWTVVGGRMLNRSDDDRHPYWRTMLRNGTTEER